MKIKRVRLYHVEIPFRHSFNHHLKKRNKSSSLILELETVCGNTGYGEGAPRPYISGETIWNNKQYFQRIENRFYKEEFNSVEDINTFINTLRFPGSRASVIAAMETALLDAFGKIKNQSIPQLLFDKHAFPIQYSGVIPNCSKDQFIRMNHQIKDIGFQEIKIKVAHKDDVEYVAIARRILGRNVDIRIDANQGWNFNEALSKIKAMAAYSISAVEEPLKKNLSALLPKLSKDINIPIILDEHISNTNQAKKWAQLLPSDKLIFNLKLSKCGGMNNTIHIYNIAQEYNIQCMLGCNVGETAILTALGRAFISAHEVCYAEGSYGRYLLEDDISRTSPGFEKHGIAQPLNGPGLGISCFPDKIDAFGKVLFDNHQPKNLLNYFITQLKKRINAKLSLEAKII